jgi:hypothetical protein
MRNLLTLSLLLMVVSLFSGCAVAGGIFKAGVWLGVLGVVVVIIIILLLVSKSRK